jgi:hypothetical protein
MLYFLILTFTLITPCYAYLDGGTSTLLLQLLYGGIGGGLVLIKIYWRKLVSCFKPKQ